MRKALLAHVKRMRDFFKEDDGGKKSLTEEDKGEKD